MSRHTTAAPIIAKKHTADKTIRSFLNLSIQS
jgi:hypothetical protein